MTSRKTLRSIPSGLAIATLFFTAALLLLAPKYAYAAIDEVEDNGTFETATPFSMNQNVYGTTDGGDYDYYKVNLPSAGKVKITVFNDKYLDGWRYLDFSLYNRYYEYTDSHQVSLYSTRPQTYLVSLSKGDNYIKFFAYTNDHPYHFKFTYVVPGTTAKKATPAKKSFTIGWEKKSGAAKYQLRYSTNKSMSGAKIVDVSKTAKSKKISGLKSGKKYYVQVRVVKNIGGQMYYSSWSSKKAVKTK